MNFNKIYNISPVFIQDLMTSVQGLIYKHQRYGKIYFSHKKTLQNRKYNNSIDNERIQNEIFLAYLKNTIENSPFYKEFYKNIDLSLIRSADDIKILPILEKEVLRKKIDVIYCTNKCKSVIMSTSGTTGKSINIKVSLSDLQKRMAYLDVFKEKYGFFNLRIKRATFNSSKIIPPNNKKNIYSRMNFFMKQRIYSGYHCTDKNMLYYISDLNRFKPQSIDGLPSVLYKISKYIIDNNIKLKFKPVAIFPTAETLLPHYRQAIEKAFGCKAYNQYSSTEASPFILECENGKLHYRMDTGIIERLEDGKILVTCFYSTQTPLIRYEIGDRIGSIEQINCSCGDSSPIISDIQGRGNEYLIALNGDKISTLFLSLVSQSFNNSIIEMQFIQENANHITVNIRTDEKYENSMDEIIIQKLKYSLGKDMIVNVKKVELFDKKGVKHPFVINKMLDKGETKHE